MAKISVTNLVSVTVGLRVRVRDRVKGEVRVG